MRRSVDPTATGVPILNDTEETVPEVVAVIAVSASGTITPGRRSSLVEFLSSLAFLTSTSINVAGDSFGAASSIFEDFALLKKKVAPPARAIRAMNDTHDIERFGIGKMIIRVFPSRNVAILPLSSKIRVLSRVEFLRGAMRDSDVFLTRAPFFGIGKDMYSKRFQKRIENFVCGRCGASVVGNGYTNHCPKCLWSRHVDRFPGDRAASCGGLMAPVSATLEQGEWQVRHRCLSCGHEKKNRLAADDDMEVFAKVARGEK